jgi:hypothetical protein
VVTSDRGVVTVTSDRGVFVMLGRWVLGGEGGEREEAWSGEAGGA